MARSSHSEILNDLGSRIEAEQLREGFIFTAAELEASYQASRTTVREALRVLESIGMIESRQRVGITITHRSHWNSLDSHLIRWRLSGPHRRQALQEFTELRMAIEPMAAQLAATHATAEECVELMNLASILLDLGEKGLGNSAEYLAADIQFHGLLLTASKNPLFLPLIAPVSETLRSRNEHGLTPAIPNTEASFGHLATARAVSNGDARQAAEYSRTYITLIHREVTTPYN